MDISADRNKTNGYRTGLFSAVKDIVQGFVRRIAEFFSLTEADRTKAGVHISKRGV
jgi:hypothetical protein